MCCIMRTACICGQLHTDLTILIPAEGERTAPMLYSIADVPKSGKLNPLCLTCIIGDVEIAANALDVLDTIIRMDGPIANLLPHGVAVFQPFRNGGIHIIAEAGRCHGIRENSALIVYNGITLNGPHLIFGDCICTAIQQP